MTTDQTVATDVVTSEQAAALLGIKPGTLRQWVFRGDLEPLVRGDRPLRFRYEDVARVQRDKRPDDWRERHRAACTALLAALGREAV